VYIIKNFSTTLFPSVPAVGVTMFGLLADTAVSTGILDKPALQQAPLLGNINPQLYFTETNKTKMTRTNI
jgi:hypothetical protein